jgi:hypothetical protein
MPIVAFRIYKNNTIPITSNSHYLSRILKGTDEKEGYYSYCAWLRGNTLIRGGIPDEDTFTGTITFYDYDGYHLYFGNRIPSEYEKLLSEVLKGGKSGNENAPLQFGQS